jgi:hypothetical protein
VQTEAEAPAPIERAARPERPERATRPARGPRLEPARAETRPRREEETARYTARDRDDDHGGVVGFGSDVPAFLLRPVVKIPVETHED